MGRALRRRTDADKGSVELSAAMIIEAIKQKQEKISMKKPEKPQKEFYDPIVMHFSMEPIENATCARLIFSP